MVRWPTARRAFIWPGRCHHRANRRQRTTIYGLGAKNADRHGSEARPEAACHRSLYRGLFGSLRQLHALGGPEDAARIVDYWAGEGVTSFKAYMAIKSDELKVVIEHAHAHGLKITGHLCAVGFREAAGSWYRQSGTRHRGRYRVLSAKETRTSAPRTRPKRTWQRTSMSMAHRCRT